MDVLHQFDSVLIDPKRDENTSWRPFLRQLVICSGAWTSYFIFGLCIGAPTVLIPQIRREANSTEAVTEDMASWLSSTHTYAGIPWIFILPILARFTGRKVPLILYCIMTFIGFIIFTLSTTTTHILISEVILGLISASQITVSLMVISEYTSPRYRGVFLTIKSATVFWGIWVSNVIGTFLHWSNIGILAIVCALYLFITLFMWPESPYWLASRGRFEKCTVSHRWLKGTDKQSEQELSNLISSAKKYLKNDKKVALLSDSIQSIKQIISQKELYKPVLICLLVLTQYHCSGKLICSVYAIDIIRKITNSESTAYTSMLILDGITVSGMYFGSILSKFVKRRTLLICTSSTGVVFLFLLALYLYLVKLTVIVENKYASVILLIFFSISISCGPIIMATSICGEILPLKCRSTSVLIIALYSNTAMATSLKLSPNIFATFKLHGAFLFYGILSLVCLIFIYLYLPETKDKTLQEISDCMKEYTSNDENELEHLQSNKIV